MTVDNFRDWERTIVLELGNEYRHVCWVHKVELRPIVIALFDSDTLWGQYNHATRTISLSRKLVREFSWHQVVGVLRHEMAHQYVAEIWPESFSVERPHNERFKEACRRLGVPAQYAKAGFHLQTDSLDWRQEPRDETTEKILERAKKLLALASSTNEHEASLAMERVRDLYAKYNLDHMEALAKEKFVHLAITHGRRRMSAWEQRTVSLLTEHFFVEVLIFKMFDVKSGQRVHALELIGTRENVLMAEYVYHFLLQQVEFLLERQKRGPLGLHRQELTSYRLGVLDGFERKLKQAETTPEAKSSLIGKALIKFRRDPRLREYMSEVHPRLTTRRSGSVRLHGGAFSAGQAAGRAITLNKPISHAGGNQGRTLSGK